MENKGKRKTGLTAVLTAAAILALVAVLTLTGNIRVAVQSDRLEIDGDYWPDRTVLFRDVESVSLAEEFHAGSRTNGFGGGRLSEGHFSNDTLGSYILYAYSRCDTCVVLKTTDGYLAVNAETPERTRELFSSIQAAFGAFQKNAQ